MTDRDFFSVESAAIANPAGDSELSDKTISCIDCSSDFVWGVGEQEFFRDKHLDNPPKRCKECKRAKNERLAAINAAQRTGIKQRIEIIVDCAQCGESTTVPFYPSQGRPVFCRSCFIRQNPSILNANGHSD
ncbi:MAG: zinc-ribbon domain containing protein [Pyrinomonadaceae bacterium]